MYIHADYAPLKECKNKDSRGYVCVKCNECGRFEDNKHITNKDIAFIKKVCGEVE